ncbi:phage holin family protein [Shewanella basaltis]|uniref:HP1 family phage holin n=1 Tax=Shewanella basaltis TaxID=472183 RepID=UPI00200CA76F|nr:HP1 family phage holin [Shewanella basaltis]MCL1114675.1 phage holin family protein [Shewanella basaltis]
MSITTDISAKFTSVVSYVASFFTAAGSYVNDMDIGVLVGVICAVATALVNWFYQSRKSDRDEQIQALQKQLLNKQLQNIELERSSHVIEDIEAEPK